MKFIQQYRLYQHNYGDAPEFVEPPSFLREYETQVSQFSYVDIEELFNSTSNCADRFWTLYAGDSIQQTIIP